MGVALVLPGFGEFIEKYHETVADLLQRGFAVHVMEWFGQGLSTRALANRDKVHVADFARHVVDLAKLVETVLPPRDFADGRLLLGHSMGGHLALRYLQQHPRSFDAAILCSPMIDINYGWMPRWLARGITATACGLGFARNYDPARVHFAANPLTTDRTRFFEPHSWIVRNSELAIGGPTFGFLRAAQRSIAATEQRDFVRELLLPVLVLASEHDRVVSLAASLQLARRLPNATYVGFADARHELLRENETVRALVWQQIDDFLELEEEVNEPSPDARPDLRQGRAARG